ncbi:MAG: helicase-exonuclease AddAB subunit AddB [Lachnospiraceae bacterium]|nr:helicase-exonuclease AddAB subunit AddB [Lachnospiraceae bacterium]
MSFQFILGGSGSGKSYCLYSWVIRQACRHPEKKFLVIVPEQFTMQTQRELVRLHPDGGILNIDVLSFERLAYRVFEETGANQRTVLTETGKNLLLRRVAAQEQEKLRVMKSRLNRPGYLSEIKSMLSELTQYDISAADLEDMIELAQKKPQLQQKLKDLLVLYEGFQEFCRERFITAEEVLDVFCQAADDSALLKNSVLAFDGFTGFTPVQQKALQKLFRLSPDIKVTVTLGEGEEITGRLQEHELFYLSKKTIHTLLRLASEAGVPVLEPIRLSGEKGRFRPDGGIAFLERNLFRYGKRAVWPEGPEPGIFLSVMKNPASEVRYAARTISRLAKEQGFRYREMAVITGDLACYGNYVRKIFEEYEIPCFLDQTVQILLNPSLEFIRGVFGIVDSGFSYEAVFRLLRSGFAGFAQEETDRLENYVLALGIRGRKRWETEWTERTDRMPMEEPSVCDSFRKRLMETLLPGLEPLEKSSGKLREYAGALYELLVSFRIQEQLKEQEDAFRLQGEPDKAREYAQIYAVIIQLLDEAVELLGDETVSRREFEEILEAGFSEARVGMIPPGIDQVHVGDMERTRLNDIRVLFFLGLNDGWIPAREGRGGIVSELEREFLQQAGVELAPTVRENSYIQRFYLYLDLTKPSQTLYLSYCKSSSDGKAMRPSYFIGVIRRMFPGLNVKDPGETEDPLEQAASLKTGLPYLAESLRRLREEEDPGGDGEKLRKARSRTEELLRQYLREAEWKDRARELAEAAFFVFGDQSLERRTAGDLYGEVLVNSVTRLEQFASCAFAHFAAYGLALNEREEYTVRSVDLGNIFHRALELFSRGLERSEYDWFTVPDQVRDALMEQAVQEAVEHYGTNIFFDNARNRYMIERMRRILLRSVWALHEQVKAGRFVPSNFEVSFSAAENLEAVNIALSEREKLRLKGRIDRIDVCEEKDRVYVKVIDYKSGNTSFDLVALYYGLQLQLVVYLNAALELEERLHPGKPVIPAGIFYYRMKDPLTEGSHEQDPEEINEAILKKLRLDGIVNQDPAVVERLDAGFEKVSLVIPVGRKADGSLTAASSAASQQQLQALSEFVQEKLGSLGREILDGKIGVRPYRRKQESACDYCAFADLCGFDGKLPGALYRELQEIPDEELWERLEKKKKDLGDVNGDMAM